MKKSLCLKNAPFFIFYFDRLQLQTTVPQICIDGLVQDWSISSALAMKILQSYTKPSIYTNWGKYGSSMFVYQSTLCIFFHILFRLELQTTTAKNI